MTAKNHSPLLSDTHSTKYTHETLQTLCGWKRRRTLNCIYLVGGAHVKQRLRVQPPALYPDDEPSAKITSDGADAAGGPGQGHEALDLPRID